VYDGKYKSDKKSGEGYRISGSDGSIVRCIWENGNEIAVIEVIKEGKT
jgi:hypothetical protein